jgi:mRNA deadenylase 3'-5' endonuclease subunit Ccr4
MLAPVVRGSISLFVLVCCSLFWQVQSNHFENFFKPKLENCGYSVLYKKKKREVWLKSDYGYSHLFAKSISLPCI